jgi:toxin ParE1/3/4
MTRRIIISPKASQDLDDHFAYIAENSFEAALHFLIQRTRRLPDLPECQSLGDQKPFL